MVLLVEMEGDSGWFALGRVLEEEGFNPRMKRY
jgi:hypothetical protein